MVGLVACGSDDDDPEGGAPPSTTGDTGVAADPDGVPIVLGLYTPTNNSTFVAPEMVVAAQAAVEYVNSELGGVDGRPLQLEVCETRNTADTMNACASELAQKSPVAVIGGPDLNAVGSINQVFKPQSIPVVGGTAIIPPEYAPPAEPVFRTVFLPGPVSLFPGLVLWAHEEFDAQKVAFVSNDLPSSQVQLATYINPTLSALGLPDAEVVKAPVASAEFTPFLQAALSSDPDALLVVGLPCLPILNAYQALGSSVPLIQADTCSDPATLEQAGSLAEGAFYVTQLRTPTLDPEDEDVAMYVAATSEFASDDSQLETTFALSAFQAVMNLRELMLTLDGDVTKESVQAAVRAASDQHNFLGHSGSYSCTPLPIPAFKGICGQAETRLAKVEDGALVYASNDIVNAGDVVGK